MRAPGGHMYGARQTKDILSLAASWMLGKFVVETYTDGWDSKHC